LTTPTVRSATWQLRSLSISNGCSSFWKRNAWSRPTMQRNRPCVRLCSGARSVSATAAATVKSPLSVYSPSFKLARGSIVHVLAYLTEAVRCHRRQTAPPFLLPRRP
jgi:hypothetical protein